MEIRSRNRLKILELKPSVRYAVTAWEAECWDKGVGFKITEAYRSQKRQKELYAQGRTKAGRKVTWTLRSLHTQGLALDVYDPKGKNTTEFFAKLTMIGKKWGITNPLTAPPYYDYGHFELTNVPPKPINKGTNSVQNRLLERVKRRIRTMTPKAIERLLKRLKKRFPNFHIS